MNGEFIYFTKKGHDQIPLRTGASNSLSMIINPGKTDLEVLKSEAKKFGGTRLYVLVNDQVFSL